MAFVASRMAAKSIGVALRPGARSLRDWRYATADTAAAVMTPGYFDAAIGIGIGDSILANTGGTADLVLLIVTDMSPVRVQKLKLDGGGGGAYSQADKLYFASVGARWPNKEAAIGASYTKAGFTSYFRGPPWLIPAGSTLYAGVPNHRNVEDNKAQNEALISADVTLEAMSLTFTDGTGTVRVVSSSSMTNGGVLSATVANGGVCVGFVLPAAIPAGSLLRFGYACGGAANMPMLTAYTIRDVPYVPVKEQFRAHAATSFAGVINAGSDPSALAGSAAVSLGGPYMPGVAFIAAYGADGRPVFYIDGDSIAYEKGTPDLIAPDRVGGIIEPGLVNAAGGASYAVTCANGAISGSGIESTNPADGVYYNATSHQHRRALIGQITALNGGTPPFTHFIEEHGTNSLVSPVAAQIALKQTRFAWLKAWLDLPIIDCAMIPNCTSTDGFRTVANQTPSGGDVRVAYRAAGIAGTIANIVGFVDTMSPISAGADDAAMMRFAVRPFVATVAENFAGGSGPIRISAAPAIGAALCLDPTSGAGLIRIVTGVTEIVAGSKYEVTHTVGSSSATWPAKVTGTTIAEAPTADGQPNIVGLHIPKPQNDIIGSATGPNSLIGIKQALKTAVAGSWT